MEPTRLRTPVRKEELSACSAGERLLLEGVLYTLRDQAHQRLCAMLEKGEKLPFPLQGAAIYYAGPSPAPPGRPIGSVGPTTSSRMDPYTPTLLEHGLALMIGKGQRSPAVREAIREQGALYCAAWGGAGALLAERVCRARVLAFPELGPEAVYELVVEDFPVVVINDPRGGDAYEMVRRNP